MRTMAAMGFRKILVYVTTRNAKHAALDRAAALARRCGAGLTLLAVAEELPLLLRQSVGAHEDLAEAFQAETQDHLKETAAPLIAEGLAVTLAVRYGKPYMEVIRAARQSPFDLVMKTAEAGGLTSLFGSTAMKLLRMCPAPVWIEKPSRRGGLRRIVAAVDPFVDEETGRALNRKIVEIAALLADIEGAELSVLHVWQAFGADVLGGRGGLSERTVASYRAAVREKAREQFDGFVESFGGRVKKEQMRLLQGDPARVIAEFTRNNRSDLIVMGSVARGGVAGMLIGSTAERVFSKIRCSILAVKPDGFVSPIT